MYVNIEIVGNLGNDPVIKTVKVGDQERKVAEMSVAVNRKSNGVKQTRWVRVSAWDAMASVAEQYLHKGSRVLVADRWYSVGAWVDQSGTPSAELKLNATRLVLLDRAEGNGHTEYDENDVPPVSDIPF